MRRFLLYFIGLYAGLTQQALALGQSGALFLADPLQPRALSLGQAWVAAADQESSLGLNPAGLAKLRGASLNAGHSLGFLGTQFSNLSLGLGLSQGVGLGIRAAYLFDQDKLTDGFGNILGEFGDQDLLLGLGLGFEIVPRWRLGFELKYFRQNLAGSEASAFAADVGLQGPLLPRLRWGLAAQNMGTGIDGHLKNFPLALRVQGGISLAFLNNLTRFSLDAQALPNEGQARAMAGLEFGFRSTDFDAISKSEKLSRYFLRLGIAQGFLTTEDARLSAGAGVIFEPNLELNYALLSVGPLPAQHRFGLSLRFENARLPGPRGASLSAPYGLGSEREPDGLRLRWQDANERVEGYNLYADWGVNLDKLNIKPINKTQQKLKNLERGRSYKFFVRPLGSDGVEGPASDILIVVAP